MSTGTCKILFIAANPSDTDRLSLDEECRAISQKIHDHDDSLELITEWAVRPDDLLQYLNEYEPQAVHFSGHGTEEKEIILVDDERKPIRVSAAALEQLFTTFKDNVRVVMLNACYSQGQAEAIVRVIDCAIGMKEEIGDEAAIVFASAFYRAVGFGRSVANAFDQGKTALMVMGIPEENTPDLLVRDGIDPATLVLVAKADAPPVTKPPPEPVPVPDIAETTPPIQQAPRPASLNEVLPGEWQVEIQEAGFAIALHLQLLPAGMFRGEMNTPMGYTVIDGQWQADQLTNRIGFNGRETVGYNVGPYVALIQVTYFDAQQLVGVTNAGEGVTFHRIGPPPGG